MPELKKRFKKFREGFKELFKAGPYDKLVWKHFKKTDLQSSSSVKKPATAKVWKKVKKTLGMKEKEHEVPLGIYPDHLQWQHEESSPTDKIYHVGSGYDMTPIFGFDAKEIIYQDPWGDLTPIMNHLEDKGLIRNLEINEVEEGKKVFSFEARDLFSKSLFKKYKKKKLTLFYGEENGDLMNGIPEEATDADIVVGGGPTFPVQELHKLKKGALINIVAIENSLENKGPLNLPTSVDLEKFGLTDSKLDDTAWVKFKHVDEQKIAKMHEEVWNKQVKKEKMAFDKAVAKAINKHGKDFDDLLKNTEMKAIGGKLIFRRYNGWEEYNKLSKSMIEIIENELKKETIERFVYHHGFSGQQDILPEKLGEELREKVKQQVHFIAGGTQPQDFHELKEAIEHKEHRFLEKELARRLIKRSEQKKHAKKKKK